MKREARDFREGMPKPVQRIPLDERHLPRRFLLLLLALAAAGAAFYFGFRRLASVDAGWTVIEADSSRGITAAGDFTLTAELGRNGADPLTERKRITSVYTQAARDAYLLYSAAESPENVHNIHWINTHPGEELSVDPRLFRSLRAADAAGRWLYLGPVYETADGMVFAASDAEAAQSDSRLDPETARWLAGTLPFLQDPESIRLTFPAENTLRLEISEAYLRWGEETGITRWIDLGWQRNAYAADDMAEALREAGCDRCLLASGDGFIRCLDSGSFDLNAMRWVQSARSVFQAAASRYTGPAAALHLLPCPAGQRPHAWLYGDGTLRTPWISPEDGLDHQPADGLACAAAGETCTALLNRLLPLITKKDVFTEDALAEALGPDTGWILCRDGSVSVREAGPLTVLRAGP